MGFTLFSPDVLLLLLLSILCSMILPLLPDPVDLYAVGVSKSSGSHGLCDVCLLQCSRDIPQEIIATIRGKHGHGQWEVLGVIGDSRLVCNLTDRNDKLRYTRELCRITKAEWYSWSLLVDVLLISKSLARCHIMDSLDKRYLLAHTDRHRPHWSKSDYR